MACSSWLCELSWYSARTSAILAARPSKSMDVSVSDWRCARMYFRLQASLTPQFAVIDSPSLFV